jgi:drug/metabolite transporter (DMT)-like permease
MFNPPYFVYTSTMNENIPLQETSHKTTGQVVVYGGILFAVVAWGASFVAARFLLHPSTVGQAALSPTVLAALRFSIASLFFVIPLVRAVIRHQVTGRDLLLMGLLGQITFSLYFWLQYTGVQETNVALTRIDASRVAVYIYFEPIVTVLLGITLLGEHLSWQTIAGAILIGGSVLMVNFIKR